MEPAPAVENLMESAPVGTLMKVSRCARRSPSKWSVKAEIGPQLYETVGEPVSNIIWKSRRPNLSMKAHRWKLSEAGIEARQLSSRQPHRPLKLMSEPVTSETPSGCYETVERNQRFRCHLKLPRNLELTPVDELSEK